MLKLMLIYIHISHYIRQTFPTVLTGGSHLCFLQLTHKFTKHHRKQSDRRLFPSLTAEVVNVHNAKQHFRRNFRVD